MVKIFYSPQFKKTYGRIPKRVQRSAEKRELIFRKNPFRLVTIGELFFLLSLKRLFIFIQLAHMEFMADLKVNRNVFGNLA